VLILPKTSLEIAKTMAANIRLKLKNSPHRDDFKVTLSLGVAERQTDEPPAALMVRADQALYRAKAAGKDGVSE